MFNHFRSGGNLFFISEKPAWLYVGTEI